jgi:F0F1-type ATP synthase membrane subunit a
MQSPFYFIIFYLFSCNKHSFFCLQSKIIYKEKKKKKHNHHITIIKKNRSSAKPFLLGLAIRVVVLTHLVGVSTRRVSVSTHLTNLVKNVSLTHHNYAINMLMGHKQVDRS